MNSVPKGTKNGTIGAKRAYFAPIVPKSGTIGTVARQIGTVAGQIGTVARQIGTVAGQKRALAGRRAVHLSASESRWKRSPKERWEKVEISIKPCWGQSVKGQSVL